MRTPLRVSCIHVLTSSGVAPPVMFVRQCCQWQLDMEVVDSNIFYPGFVVLSVIFSEIQQEGDAHTLTVLWILADPFLSPLLQLLEH